MRETPLTLVSGPAGSGKTTLAGSWMTRPGVPWRVVWLTLSEATGSPEEFWFFVTEALGRAGVDLPHSSRVAGMSPAGEGFVIRLATDLLERDEPVVLVLDEVERLTDPAVPAQLELLMRLAGLSLRLVLLSRVDPLLPHAAVPHGRRRDRDPHGRPGLHHEGGRRAPAALRRAPVAGEPGGAGDPHRGVGRRAPARRADPAATCPRPSATPRPTSGWSGSTTRTWRSTSPGRSWTPSRRTCGTSCCGPASSSWCRPSWRRS